MPKKLPLVPVKPRPSLITPRAFKKGAFATFAALNGVLAGGGAKAQQAPASEPKPAVQLPDVVVTADEYKADSLSLPKYGEPLLTTPQSATVVTSQVMKDQGVTSLRDSLRNVSGISIGAGEGSYQGDNLSIRGFAARSDIFLDGMSDTGNYNRDPFNIEEVEVLKGPSSAEFGRGSSGGVVNLESKVPHLEGFIAGSLLYGTDHTKRGTLDFNEPISGMEGAAFRVNLMANDGDVTDRNGASYGRWGVAPSVAFGLGTDTRLTVSYFHQTESNLPDYGIPWLADRPAPVDRKNFYGFSDDYLKTDVNIGTIRFEHDFNDTFTLREQFRVEDAHRSFRISQASTDGIAPGDPLNHAKISREIIDGVSNDRSFDEDVSLVSKFDTGPVKHSLVTGFEYLHQSVDPRRTEPTWANVPETSLFNPVSNISFPGTGTTGTEVNAHVDQISAYAIDTMKLGSAWSVIGGLRFDRVSSHYDESITDSHFSATDEAVTWRAAVVYQPQANGSIYVASGTSFHPNVQQLSVSSEPALPPSTKDIAVGRNFEVEMGTKWDLFDNHLSLSGALFWDEQTNPSPVDLDDPLLDVLHGKERVKGIEFGAIGRLTDKWRLLLNYTLQASKVTSSSDPTLLGNPVLNAPKNIVALWSTYELPWKFQVGFGANAVSSRTASQSPDPANGLLMEAPGYVIYSAMLKYHLTDKIDLQVNVMNLTDRYYYDGVHPGHVVPGPGRTLYLSTNFKF
ncbi:MAG: TonB-dependent siderophore receptor [Verrucomicrobiaceae bacterium]|nr:TonB-dependent siderophore receptor [Verrucomicrobiaceae bacterium]